MNPINPISSTTTDRPAGKAQNDNPLKVGTFSFQSRLMVGTGKYKDFAQTKQCVLLSGAELVTVALKRTNLGQNKTEPNLLDLLPMDQFTILPNTAGCFDAQSAIHTCLLARELLDGHPLVKLEVLTDATTLMPNVIETLKASEALIKEGFEVMVYTSDDLHIAKQLEQMGCVAIMPLAAPIGSGQGIQNKIALEWIVNEIKVPVIVDAGVGTASHATEAMELGCDGVLMNTAIAKAGRPEQMAEAMKLAVQAGRLAYLAGAMPAIKKASPSSPIELS